MDARTWEAPMLRATLFDLLAAYATEQHLQPGSAATYGWTLRAFAKFLGHPPIPSDLTDDTASRWLLWCEGCYGQNSVAHHRVNLLVLWRWAADRGDVSRPPGRIRREKKPQPMPTAPTPDAMRRGIAAARLLPGRYMGAPRAVWAEALLRVCWETGLRRGDIRRISHADIGADGVVQLAQHKTGAPLVVQISQETLALVRQIPRAYPFCSYDPERTYDLLRVVSVVAGERITMQAVRRAGATDVFRESGEDGARRYLGHAVGSSTWRYYVDMRQVGKEHPKPREI